MDKQTSDERLLKLLEGQYASTHGQTQPGQTVQAKPVRQAGKRPVVGFKPLELFARLRPAKFDLAYANRPFFALAFLASAVFFYVLFVAPALSPGAGVILHPSDITQVQRLIKVSQGQLEARGNIPQQGVERDIFLPFGAKASYELEQEANIEDEIGIYRLVGIIWSQTPEAMVESDRDFRTLVVKKGDSLGENCRVKEVSRNSVVLQVSTKDGSRDYELR